MERWTAIALLALLLAVVASCGEEEALETPAPVGSDAMASPVMATPTSAPESEPSPTPLYEWDAFSEQAQMYADQIGVSLDEAKDRLSRQDDFGLLNAALYENEQETFAGAFLQHQPEFRFVVLFTRDGEQTIRKYVTEGSDLDEYVEVRHVRYSLAELEEIRHEADAILQQVEGFNVSSSINVMENRVEYFVQNSAQAEQVLADAGLDLPEPVALVGDGPPVEFEVPEGVPGIYIAIPKPTLDGGGAQMEALFIGALVLVNGCLWLESDFDDHLTMPIWHYDHRLRVDGDVTEVVNGSGEVIARVGEPIYMGGGGFAMALMDQDLLHYPIPDDCRTGSVWAVGSIDPLDEQPVVPTPVPEGAPLGLHTVAWPADFDSARALLDMLPEQLAEGWPHWMEPEQSGRIVVGYGPQDEPGMPKLVITDLTTGVYFPDYWTANDLMASQFTGFDGIAFGVVSDVTWASEDTNHSGRVDRYDEVPVGAFNWGSSNGRVLFTASAEDHTQLELLVAAVLSAAE